MATKNTYTADGSSALFPVSFPYIDKSHVQVRLAGVLQIATKFTWDTPSSIRFLTVPPAGAEVEIRRVTPSAPLTTYQSGSTLTEEDLETDSLQALYLIEELAEEGVSTEAVDAHIAELVSEGGIGADSLLVAYNNGNINAQTRTVNDQLKDQVVSVLEFIPSSEHAAIRNSTTTYDATVAVQNAINYVGNKGGGILKFPRGSYGISAKLVVNFSNVTLLGEGGGNYVSGVPNVRGSAASRIFWLAAAPAAGTPMLEFATPPGGLGMCNGGARGLMIDGMTVVPVGLKLTSWKHGNFEDLVVYATTEDCFLLDIARYALGSGYNGITYLNTFKNCVAITWGGSGWYLTNTTKGFRFVGAPPENTGDSSENTFINCGAFLAFGVAFYLESCGQNVFISCYGGAQSPSVPQPYYNVHLCSADQNSANPGSLVGASRYHLFLWSEMKFLVRASQVSGGSSSFGCMLYGLSEGNVNTDPVTIESPSNGGLPPTVQYTTSGTKTDPSTIRAGQFRAAHWDDSNTVGPGFFLDRNASVGAAGMGLGYLQWNMTNSAGTRNISGGLFQGAITSAVPGAESVSLNLVTKVSGALTSAMQWKDGVIVPQTGGGLTFKGYGTVNINGEYYVDNTQVLGPRQTGWTAATGTALKGAWATYAGQTHTGSYVQATIQALDNAVRDASQRIKALEDALRTHGQIN
ncbi:MAG TPA: phage tail fiber protein [Streptomyces sp.]|jgi:Phage T7 tail fibre protein.